MYLARTNNLEPEPGTRARSQNLEPEPRTKRMTEYQEPGATTIDLDQDQDQDQDQKQKSDRPETRNQKSDQNPKECLPVLGIEVRIEYCPQTTRTTLGAKYMIHLPLWQSNYVVIRWTIGVVVILRISVAASVFAAATLVCVGKWAAVVNTRWSHPAGAESVTVFVGGARD